MRVSELNKLAKQHGCEVKPHGRGLWRIQRTRDNYSLITTSQLKSVNEAKLVSCYLPEARVERSGASC